MLSEHIIYWTNNLIHALHRQRSVQVYNKQFYNENGLLREMLSLSPPFCQYIHLIVGYLNDTTYLNIADSFVGFGIKKQYSLHDLS